MGGPLSIRTTEQQQNSRGLPIVHKICWGLNCPPHYFFFRADSALQDIVYKVVPGLYRAEMSNRAKFYSNHPEAEPLSLEDAGEISDRLFFSPEDDISMSIEYFDSFR